MLKASIFPGKYIQGYNAIYSLDNEIKRINKESPFIVCDPYVLKNILDKNFINQFTKNSILKEFSGECTDEFIGDSVNIANKGQCDLVVGIGGGKTLDSAKAIANILGVPVVIIPTSASTDAPCSALSVIYTTDGNFKRYEFFKKNPDIVIVDSKIIAEAPVRLLVSGIGDALATWFEAESCSIKYAKNMAGGLGTNVAFSIAKLCYELLLKYGLQAKIACESKIVTPALEHIIEANILLSGIGFESGGLAAAHAIHNGLTVLTETHKYFHGEKVAFGLLCSLFLTDKSTDVINNLYDFYLTIGLPTAFEDIGLVNISDDKLKECINYICMEGETIYNEPVTFNNVDVLNALKMANAFGKHKKANINKL
jgi:glycerol dehydrogenase